jgi:hypothetical protein
MPHSDITFATDQNIRMRAVNVADEIESKDYGAVAAVFKGDDAAVRGAVLDGGEDVCDGDLWGEGDGLVREGV